MKYNKIRLYFSIFRDSLLAHSLVYILSSGEYKITIRKNKFA